MECRVSKGSIFDDKVSALAPHLVTLEGRWQSDSS